MEPTHHPKSQVTQRQWDTLYYYLQPIQVISTGSLRLDAKNLTWFINWQAGQLLQNNTYLHTILASQQIMLRVTEYRQPFVHSTCLDKMLNILSTRISFQVVKILS